MPLYGLIGENLFLAAEILSCCPYTGCVPPHRAALWVPCGCICTTTCITLYTLHCTMYHSALCITLHCASLCSVHHSAVCKTVCSPLWVHPSAKSPHTHSPLAPHPFMHLAYFFSCNFMVFKGKFDWTDLPCCVCSAKATYFLQGCCFERNHAWSGLSDKWVTDGQRVELGMTAATINWTHNWPPWATLWTTGAKSLKTSTNNFGQKSKLILHSILSIWIIV